eukprot:194501_1
MLPDKTRQTVSTLVCALSLYVIIICVSYWIILQDELPVNSLLQINYTNTNNKIVRGGRDKNDSDYFFIWQIGFPKMGCTSLAMFFNDNNIPSTGLINTRFSDLEKVINIQTRNSKPTFGNLTNQFRYFGDFGADVIQPNASHTYLFEDILYYYPNSKFILNIRQINVWLKSRYFHWYGGEKKASGFMLHWIQNFPAITDNYNKYLCFVIDYFYNHKYIKDDLLVFDIEKDSIEKLITYFQRFNLCLNESLWGHSNARVDKSYINDRFYKRRVEIYKKHIESHPEYMITNSSNTYNYLKTMCSFSANITYYQ